MGPVLAATHSRRHRSRRVPRQQAWPAWQEEHQPRLLLLRLPLLLVLRLLLLLLLPLLLLLLVLRLV